MNINIENIFITLFSLKQADIEEQKALIEETQFTNNPITYKGTKTNNAKLSAPDIVIIDSFILKIINPLTIETNDENIEDIKLFIFMMIFSI